MRLDDLLAALDDQPALRGLSVLGVDADRFATVELRAAAHDSRRLVPGDLFCCVRGRLHDGHDHAAAAVAAGAAALLVERPLGLGVPELVVPDVRRAMGPVAAVLLGDPSATLDVVGVTGTNGKTTTTHLLAAVLNRAGRNCGVIGTLSGVRTTPEAPELQQLLAAFLAEGRRSVAMEVSSHALDLHRVDGTHFRVAVFTNLSRDHLDHHADMAAYFQAKAMLFEPDRCELAVLCTDDPHGRLLLDAALVPSLGYGIADAADLEISETGSRFTWRGVAMAIALPGRFNVLNALAAATVAAHLGVPPEVIAAGLADVSSIPGRFELVHEGQPFVAAVDFAHTPDALAGVLGSPARTRPGLRCRTRANGSWRRLASPSRSTGWIHCWWRRASWPARAGWWWCSGRVAIGTLPSAPRWARWWPDWPMWWCSPPITLDTRTRLRSWLPCSVDSPTIPTSRVSPTGRPPSRSGWRHAAPATCSSWPARATRPPRPSATW
ncbi:MAG TPA: UDP-N-acetylmuramyl-tripeptide synthetase [Acidimicrobiales bacterium]|nr:UDP-N-acetylmuramyl-tripeptide synthetase [Acidimicrobiales bacterium]